MKRYQYQKGSSLASKSYIGTINGIDVTKDLMADRSNTTMDVVHFILPKPVVIQLAEQVEINQHLMNLLYNQQILHQIL